MAMLNKSRLHINTLNRRSILVLSANNVAGKCGSGADRKGSGSEQDGMAKNSQLFRFFTSCTSPSNPSTPTIYECRKYGHRLPVNNVKPTFEVLPNIPSGIFRCTVGEQLGTGAGKGCYYNYKCPEYFSYHHMTFYDLHLILRKCRNPSPKTGRKP